MSNSLVIDGLGDAIKALGEFTEDMDILAFNGVDQVLTTIESDMVSRASGRFNKYAEGVLLNSISHVTQLKGEEGIFGSVGVYDMSNKTGSGDRRLESPIIASFLEGGVQPHSLASGVRAPKRGTPDYIVEEYNTRVKADSPGLWHPGFAGYPFMQLAFDANADSIGTVVMQNFDKAVVKL